ncbi:MULTISPECIES: hypothetical protein [unclassified Mesorhizobium]|nr:MULTISPECIES: hypothetical protein [unclassified Mesorhizobium]
MDQHVNRRVVVSASTAIAATGMLAAGNISAEALVASRREAANKTVKSG